MRIARALIIQRARNRAAAKRAAFFFELANLQRRGSTTLGTKYDSRYARNEVEVVVLLPSWETIGPAIA